MGKRSRFRHFLQVRSPGSDCSDGHFLAFHRHLDEHGRKFSLQLGLIDRRLGGDAGADHAGFIMRERDP